MIENLTAFPDHRINAPAKGLQTSQIPYRGRVRGRACLLATAGALLLVSGCASVPGETLAPASVRRDVSARILTRASQAKPECKRVKIADTEVLEVHTDGKVAAERWVVDRCDERVNFTVTFPPAGRAGTVQIRSE